MDSLITNINENLMIHMNEQNLDVIKLLLKYDKNLNYSLLLYRATYYGFFELIKILIEDYKIDINTLNEYGENSLYTATKQKFFLIAEYLIKRGINTDLKHFHHYSFKNINFKDFLNEYLQNINDFKDIFNKTTYLTLK